MKFRQPKNLVGHKWGRMEVLKYLGLFDRNHQWECRCLCGNTSTLRSTQINRKTVQSCGCLGADMLSVRSTTYGEGRTPLAAIWRTMIARCHNENCREYPFYGAKGIKVCDRWRNSFLAFKEDVGVRPPRAHLDRYPDNTGHYEPNNVRWATPKENQRNRRNNVRVTLNGVNKTLIEWAEEKGLRYGTVWARLKRGQTSEQSLE